MSILILCFFGYFVLSWVLLFRDPRALIGIGNLYPMLEPHLFPIQTVLTQYGLNSIPTILFAVLSIVAVLFYLRSLVQKISLRSTILIASLIGIITFFSFPVLSTDIFSYIMTERVATVHQENIWQVKPAAFPDDQFAVLADWKDTTSVYGGLHYYMYLVPSLIGQNDLLTLVILYKVIPTIFVFGTMYLLYHMLTFSTFKEPERVLRLVFWNPLLVLELFGSAHNDSMMLFFALLGLYLFRRKLWLFSGIVFALAVQIKLIPIVLFFFCLSLLVLNKNIRNAIIFLISFFGINALFFSLMQINILDFLKRVAYNGGVYWQSFPNILQTFSPEYVKYIGILFLLWVCLYTIMKFLKSKNPVHTYVTIILIYLFFVSAAYWNWYVLWILPFIIFTGDKKLFMVTLVLSITSLFAYPLLWVIHRINTPSDYWSLVTYIFIFAPPIATYLLAIKYNNKFTTLFHKLGLHKLIADKPVNSV